MKKKLQKYLSGSNEGFSLVELIIVIAIMAILIGVVALAVIPYLEKSRESKDLQALSSLSNALSSAVADTKVTTAGSFTIADGSPVSDAGLSDPEKKVAKSMADSLGGSAVDVSSKGANNCDITCYFDPSTNTVAVYVATGQGVKGQGAQPSDLEETTTVSKKDADGNAATDTVQCCNYNDHAPLIVSNGGEGVTTTKVSGS